jgi:hypothetical protein
MENVDNRLWVVGDGDEVYIGLDEAVRNFVDMRSEDDMPDTIELWEYAGDDCEPTGEHITVDVLGWLKENDFELYRDVMSLR